MVFAMDVVTLLGTSLYSLYFRRFTFTDKYILSGTWRRRRWGCPSWRSWRGRLIRLMDYRGALLLRGGGSRRLNIRQYNGYIGVRNVNYIIPISVSIFVRP